MHPQLVLPSPLFIPYVQCVALSGSQMPSAETRPFSPLPGLWLPPLKHLWHLLLPLLHFHDHRPLVRSLFFCGTNLVSIPHSETLSGFLLFSFLVQIPPADVLAPRLCVFPA